MEVVRVLRYMLEKSSSAMNGPLKVRAPKEKKKAVEKTSIFLKNT